MRFLINKLAGEEGFEPSHRDPESRVLPLDDSPAIDGAMYMTPNFHQWKYRRFLHVVELKSRRFSELVNDILPSIVASATPQKAGGIGLQIQNLLSNPLNPPIISPHPTDINAPPYYFSLALLKSYYQTLARRTKKSVFVRMTRAWMLAHYGGREVILC